MYSTYCPYSVPVCISLKLYIPFRDISLSSRNCLYHARDTGRFKYSGTELGPPDWRSNTLQRRIIWPPLFCLLPCSR